jgi:hypothetical protein
MSKGKLTRAHVFLAELLSSQTCPVQLIAVFIDLLMRSHSKFRHLTFTEQSQIDFQPCEFKQFSAYNYVNIYKVVRL